MLVSDLSLFKSLSLYPSSYSAKLSVFHQAGWISFSWAMFFFSLKYGLDRFVYFISVWALEEVLSHCVTRHLNSVLITKFTEKCCMIYQLSVTRINIVVIFFLAGSCSMPQWMNYLLFHVAWFLQCLIHFCLKNQKLSYSVKLWLLLNKSI